MPREPCALQPAKTRDGIESEGHALMECDAMRHMTHTARSRLSGF